MPKKNSRSALYYFAREKIEAGVLPNNIRDAIEAVYPEWQTMSAVEKQPYEKKYQDYKESLKEINREKEIEIKIEKGIDYLNEKKNNVRNELRKFFEENLYIKTRNTNQSLIDLIKEQRWYFIKFQTFCKSDYNPYEIKYNPYYVLAEVGVVEYSLFNGIIDQFHEFIPPNKIPLGHRAECMDSTRDVHQIPVDNFPLVKLGYEQIYNKLASFLSPKEENNFFTPVFCLSKDIQETHFGLKFLRDITGSHSSIKFYDKVFDLESLVIELASLFKTNISFNAANELLTSYSYDYSPNSRCQYHEDLGVSNCALGYSKRAAYHISDQLCPSFDIKVTERHLPVEKPVGTFVQSETFKSKKFGPNSHSRYSNSNRDMFKNEPPYNKRSYETENDQSRYSNYVNTTSSSIKNTDERTYQMPNVDIRYRSQHVQQTGRSSTRVLVSEKFESNLNETRKSVLRDDQSTLSSRINDEDEGWSMVRKQSNNDRNMDTVSDVSGSILTSVNSDFTTRTVSTTKYMGRGKAFVKKN